MVGMVSSKQIAHLAFFMGVLVIVFGAYLSVRGTSENSEDIEGENEFHLLETISLLDKTSRITTPQQSFLLILEDDDMQKVWKTSLSGDHFEYALKQFLHFNATFSVQSASDQCEESDFSLSLKCAKETNIDNYDLNNQNSEYMFGYDDSNRIRGFVYCDSLTQKNINNQKASYHLAQAFYSFAFEQKCGRHQNEMKCLIASSKHASSSIDQHPYHNIHFEFVFEGRHARPYFPTNKNYHDRFKFKSFESSFLHHILRNISTSFTPSFRVSSKINHISTLSTSYRKYNEEGNEGVYRLVKEKDLISAIRHGGGASASISRSMHKLSSQSSFLSLIVLVPDIRKREMLVLESNTQDISPKSKLGLDNQPSLLLYNTSKSSASSMACHVSSWLLDSKTPFLIFQHMNQTETSDTDDDEQEVHKNIGENDPFRSLNGEEIDTQFESSILSIFFAGYLRNGLGLNRVETLAKYSSLPSSSSLSSVIIREWEAKVVLLNNIESTRDRLITSLSSIETLISSGGRLWNTDQNEIYRWKKSSDKLKKKMEKLGKSGEGSGLSLTSKELLDCLSMAEDAASWLQRSVTLYAGESFFPLEHLAAIFLPMWMPLLFPLLTGFVRKSD